MIVAVHISPNQKLNDIIVYLYQSLLAYTVQSAALFDKDNNKLSMILSSDFNVNFALDKSMKLVEFLIDNLNLYV